MLKENNIAIPAGMKELVEQKSQETQLQRRSSVLNAAGMSGLISNQAMGGGGGSSAASSSELRELKLKLARKEKEVKELKEELD